MAIYQAETRQPNNIPFTLSGLPDGPDGVALTLDAMRRFVKAGKVNPNIRMLAESIISGIPGKNYRAEASAVHDWVNENIRYTRDINNVEMVKTPELILQTRQGDCDDMATLEATLLETIGHPARFVAVGFDQRNFSHVYVETKLGNKWVASDCTENRGFGWFPPNVNLRMVRHI